MARIFHDRLHRLQGKEIENVRDGEERTDGEKHDGGELFNDRPEAVVAVGKEKLVVANCDDSKASLFFCGVAVTCLLLFLVVTRIRRLVGNFYFPYKQ